MLLDAQRKGVRMTHLLMIGRQSLFLHPSELRQLRKAQPGALPDYQWGEYADRFFKECLRVEEVSTLDYSSYEGAGLLHDLNQPVGDELKGRFDVIVEAGSLEHVFNFPVAVANLMNMAKVGGTLSISTVSNNLCGHGFYQFSPELIFRVFTRENGFQLGEVLALEARYPGVELVPMTNAFAVPDPVRIGARVGLMTSRPIMLFFHARKIADVIPFSRPPLQSDYVAAWGSHRPFAGSRVPQWVRRLPLYGSFRNRWRGLTQLREFSLKNKRVFQRLRARGSE
ncbi:MAG TPA: hypothetical protein VF133_09695 [Terriglobales bacterium]